MIITFLYALALYWMVLAGMSQLKWLLGGTEWWSRKLGSDRIPLLPHSRVPAEHCEQHLPFSSPGPQAVSLSLHQCLRVSVLFLTWSHPAQAIPEDTACPEQLSLSWFLLRATSPSQLRGLSKGYFPLLPLLKWRFRWLSGRKNLSLKDTSQVWDAAIWGHPQAEGTKEQKRLWEADKAVRRRQWQWQELTQWEAQRGERL